MKSRDIKYSSNDLPVIQFWQQCLIGASLVAILCLGQFVFPFWIIVLGLLGIPLIYFILRDNLFSLIAYIGIIIAVKLRVRQDEVSSIDIIAGIIMTGILFSILIQRKMFERRQVITHSSLYLVVTFAVWAFGIGLINVIQGNTNVISLYREFLTFSPLIFIPVLFNGIVEKDERGLKTLIKVLFLFWIIEEIASVLFVRQSVQSVIFLYETGRANFNVIRSSVSIFLFITLSTIKSQEKYTKFYILGILISTLGLLLTFNRTGYVITLILIPFLILTTPKLRRKSALKVVFSVVSIVIIVGGFAYFTFPTLQLLLKWSYAKFLTASNVKADASLYNRYVEWRYVWKQILDTPISGVGFAGQFKDYVWLVGFTINAFYTHSGVLGILLKSGIVGLILISTAYIRFFILGIQLSLSNLLTDTEKGFARFGVFVIVLISLHSLTLNPLMHREILWYLGLVWGYYIYVEKKIKERSLDDSK